MVEEKWLDLLDNINEKFEILKKEKEEMERTTKPMIIDKKVHYNRTSGTGGKVEYILSDTEKTSKVTAFKKDDFGNWEEINLPGGNLSF